MREANFDLTSSRIDLQRSWTSRTRGDAVPWRTYGATHGSYDGPLSLYLGERPKWVATAPGTQNSTFERPAFGAAFGKRPKGEWDVRFNQAHALDHNPVKNGVRRGLDNRVGVGVVGSSNPVARRVDKGLAISPSP